MPSYTYDPGLVFDNTTSQPARSAVGYLLDSAGGTPQPVYDLLGNLLPNLSTSPDGYLARFKAGIPTGVVTFGAVGQPVISVEAQNAAPQAAAARAAAEAAAVAAQAAQAAAQAVQTGAATTDASKLTTGTLAAARLPDLSSLYGAKSAVDANTSAIAATQAQQTQLMQVAATTDEMLTTCTVSTATTGHILLAAPFALTIAQVFMTAPAAALAADDVNYMTVELFRFRAGGTASIGLKTTKTPASGGEALVMNQPWTFDGASLTASRMQMSPLDGLRVNITKTGTAVLPLELHFTVRWVPGLG